MKRIDKESKKGPRIKSSNRTAVGLDNLERKRHHKAATFTFTPASSSEREDMDFFNAWSTVHHKLSHD